MEEVEQSLPSHPVKRTERTPKEILKVVIMCLSVEVGAMCFTHLGSFFPPVICFVCFLFVWMKNSLKLDVLRFCLDEKNNKKINGFKNHIPGLNIYSMKLKCEACRGKRFEDRKYWDHYCHLYWNGNRLFDSLWLSGNLVSRFSLEVHSTIGFFALCMLSRVIQGIAYVGIFNVSFMIVSQEYSDYFSTLLGILEMSLGFGISAGPTYGGIVYDNFGFKGPFLGLFVVLLVLWVLAYFMMQKSPEYEQMEDSEEEDPSEEETISWRKLIQIPETFVLALCAVLPNIAFTSLDVSLTLHLIEKFHVSHSIAGMIMFFSPGSYALSAPLVGFLVDKKNCPVIIIGIGSTIFGLGYLLLGPVPFLHIKPSLWIVCFSLILIGLGVTFMYVPLMALEIQALRSKRIRMDTKAIAYLTTILLFFTNCGNFIGPLTGGFILQSLGFEWASLVYASLSFSIVMSYGAESWTFSKEVIRRIRAFEGWCYRRVLKISWKDHVTNEMVEEKMGCKRELVTGIGQRKMRFAGHVLRGSSGELANLVLEGTIDGKRDRGKQRKTWNDDVKNWSRTGNLGNAKRKGEDKSLWHSIVVNLRIEDDT
ncbi:MFS-type transporter SLC18B1 [Nymphon striatum]|nr:MFS-type transporter SLC18B1 [Nymphon striatum]